MAGASPCLPRQRLCKAFCQPVQFKLGLADLGSSMDVLFVSSGQPRRFSNSHNSWNAPNSPTCPSVIETMSRSLLSAPSSMHSMTYNAVCHPRIERHCKPRLSIMSDWLRIRSKTSLQPANPYGTCADLFLSLMVFHTTPSQSKSCAMEHRICRGYGLR